MTKRHIYVVDEYDYLNTLHVVDSYTSVIWTERFNDAGDLQLVLSSDDPNAVYFQERTVLMIDGSQRLMIVQTVEQKLNDDGTEVINVTGIAYEYAIYQDRIARNGVTISSVLKFNTLTAEPTWNLSGTPATIARAILLECTYSGISAQLQGAINQAVSPSGVGYGFYNLPYPTPRLDENATSIDVALDLMTVADAMNLLLKPYNMGVRFWKVPGKNKPTLNATWEVYTGVDRTVDSTLFPPVVFSVDLDTLADMSQLRSNANYKSEVWVIAVNDVLHMIKSGVVYTQINGSEKHVLFSKADDLTAAKGTTLTKQMTLRGTQELAKYPLIYAFDGEIPQTSAFVYGVDYNVGDLVSMVALDGTEQDMYVTEHILSVDANGEKSYPTLSVPVVSSVVAP